MGQKLSSKGALWLGLSQGVRRQGQSGGRGVGGCEGYIGLLLTRGFYSECEWKALLWCSPLEGSAGPAGDRQGATAQPRQWGPGPGCWLQKC